jgi:hypothetical protein
MEGVNMKKSIEGDWLGEALDPVLGKRVLRFNYRKANKSRGRRFDTLELHFANGRVSIQPDPVDIQLELVVWFTPARE